MHTSALRQVFHRGHEFYELNTRGPFGHACPPVHTQDSAKYLPRRTSIYSQRLIWYRQISFKCTISTYFSKTRMRTNFFHNTISCKMQKSICEACKKRVQVFFFSSSSFSSSSLVLSFHSGTENRNNAFPSFTWECSLKIFSG